MDFALAYFSMQYRSVHPEDKEFTTPTAKDMLSYLASLTKGLQLKQTNLKTTSLALFNKYGKMADAEFLASLKTSARSPRSIKRVHAPHALTLVHAQAGGGVWDSIKKLAWMVVGGDGEEYGTCGKIFQALALILIGITVSVAVGLIVKGMIAGASFMTAAGGLASSSMFNNGIQDPLRFAMDKVPELLSFYDGLMAGFGHAFMNGISQLAGNEECVAALGPVQITHVGAAVSAIANQLFSGYLYYKCIIVPGSLALASAGVDCTTYMNAQKASYTTGTKIFVFEELPGKIRDILLASDGEPCEEIFNPFGIGGGNDDC
jgi:hypothetical protein